MLDSVATLAGPLLAAVLVELSGVAVVFALAAGASLAAAALLLRLRYDAPPRPLQSLPWRISTAAKYSNAIAVRRCSVSFGLTQRASTMLSAAHAVTLQAMG